MENQLTSDKEMSSLSSVFFLKQHFFNTESAQNGNLVMNGIHAMNGICCWGKEGHPRGKKGCASKSYHDVGECYGDNKIVSKL